MTTTATTETPHPRRGTVLMAARHKDITGMRFGRLVAIRRINLDKPQERNARWLFQCDCGSQHECYAKTVTSGGSKSCGCLKRDLEKSRGTHRWSGGAARVNVHPLYETWRSMLGRCHCTGSTNYKNYGGRGLTVCDEWRENFMAFVADVGEKPSAAHTLDRVDNSKGYEPGNVKWSTPREQLANRRTTRFLTVNGICRPISDWSRESGLDPAVVFFRLKRGWPPEKAIDPRKYSTRGKPLEELRAKQPVSLVAIEPHPNAAE